MEKPSISSSDEELMKAYQMGDAAAFQILYQRHSGRIWAYVRQRFVGVAPAEDVFQAVFLKLHQSRDRYDPTLPFLPWLFAICRNTITDQHRTQALRPTVTDPLQVEQLAASPALPSAEVPSLAGLPEKQRQAIELRFHDDLSFDEIAKRLGTTQVNIRQIISRGLRKLRSMAQLSERRN